MSQSGQSGKTIIPPGMFIEELQGDAGSPVSGPIVSILGHGTTTPPSTLTNSGIVFTGDGVHTLSATSSYVNMSDTNGSGAGVLYLNSTAFLSAPGGITHNRISLGHGVAATTDDSIAIGAGSSATSTQGGIAIGTSSSASGTSGLAIGQSAQSSGTTSMAIGTSAQASGISSVALGISTVCSANDSVSIGGTDIESSSSQCFAAGNDNDIKNTTNGIMIVNNQTIDGCNNSIVLGSTASGGISSKSNIIVLGNNLTPTASNQLMIGSGTGTGTGQLSSVFISGIDGVNVGSVATVVTEASNQLGTAVITAGTGISVTPSANTITIASTVVGGIQTITGNSGGPLSGTNITFTGGSTGLTFAGAGTTETLGGTLAIANGGTNATSFTQSNGIVTYNGTRLVNYAGPQISSAGIQTNTTQPAFAAYLSATQSNVTGDGTSYNIPWNSTTLNQQTVLNTGTGVFTAPVAGLYHFSLSVYFGSLSGSNSAVQVQIVSSGASSQAFINQMGSPTIAFSGNLSLVLSVDIALAANDTVVAKGQVFGSTKSVSVQGGAGNTSFFTGFLVC